MSKSGRKFVFHGAFKSKSAAVRKERSRSCGGRCFILRRKKRYFVLSRKR